MQNYITKKDLLNEMNISYGQLYRWKRLGLIPEDWFIKRSAITGQETVLPKEKTIKRITEIQTLMKNQSLESLVERFAFSAEKEVIEFEDLYKSEYVRAEYVSAVGNYFKKQAYTAVEYMSIICCAKVAESERLNTRQFVDLIRYALPLAKQCKKTECRFIVFAAGGDYHISIMDNTSSPLFDSGLRILGEFNLETMWEEVKNKI